MDQSWDWRRHSRGLELGLAVASMSRPGRRDAEISSSPALRWKRLALLTTRDDVCVRTLTAPEDETNAGLVQSMHGSDHLLL